MDTQRLIELIEAAGCTPEHYQGRGMVHQCIGLHVSSGREMRLLSRIVRVCATPEEAGDLVNRAEIDSPLLYWPHSSWVEYAA